ncbi:hypothetical protein [Saccharopolyspora hattusasensis]|uniref:hypothetical protein n=1 Tax=Saccharopolyspora hattusasensis TaxID=1128679 RepID=UPI003D95CFAC
MSTTDAHAAGLRRALTYVSTEINDAGRTATQVQETAHPAAAGAPGFLGELAARANVPVAATTANISGDAGPEDRGPAVTLDEVHTFLTTSGLTVSVIVDGGVCPAANHMTIIDCFTPEAKLVRTGLVHQRAVAATLGRDIRAS